jgi:hypothetical protein
MYEKQVDVKVIIKRQIEGYCDCGDEGTIRRVDCRRLGNTTCEDHPFDRFVVEVLKSGKRISLRSNEITVDLGNEYK